MRLSAATALLLCCVALSGCTSSSGPESLSAGLTTSKETTSSIVPAVIPSAAVGQTAEAAQSETHQEVLAWAGKMPEPQPFADVDRTAGMPMPENRPVAMLRPNVPDLEAEPAILKPRRGTRMQVYGQNFRDAHPINFGKTSPRKHAVHGVDVSRWQGNIDWVKLRTQGANFAFIKATDGGDHLDPMFKTNWRKAREAGVRRGAYHFFYWCRTAGEQADWFIRNVPREAGALPPVIDVEYNGESKCQRRLSRAKVLEKMQVFMDKLEAHYGQRPIIYTAPDFYEDNLSGEFPNHPFWLRSVAAHPSVRYPNRKWVFWQYSGSGLSHGVEGRIDLNVFRGSEDDWHKWVAAKAG
ncbi:glycoside hydrolase family 25 protein [Pararhizobium arenae]|uniref:glycoside hydrolase family 25 protein n=1 Tax=Pararhizobium arenae TaxID=1856850 RepID=UPI00094B6D7D|nr:GH25 family lysozyme [Pararhizobium arenae]